MAVRAEASVCAAHLFEKQAVGDEVRTDPAVLFWHAQSHKASLGHLRQRLEGDPVLRVEVGGVGCHLAVGELRRAFSHVSLFRAQAEVHGTSHRPKLVV